MEIKCYKCGRICTKDDVFCARCGNKINHKDLKDKSAKNGYFQHANTKKSFDNFFVGVFVLLLMMLLAVSILLYFILTKHDSQREVLKFKNLMANPAQIPLLKEPADYINLKDNLLSVERFLNLYIEQSGDPKEKKIQIFCAFLEQLEKLPNILNLKYNPQNIIECAKTKNISACSARLNKIMNSSGVKVYNNEEMLYLYPDYKFFEKEYSQSLPYEYKKYLSLQAKYNVPISLGINMYMQPKKLADKIYDFEKFYLKTQDVNIKESIEKVLYEDVRKFIFTPSIYQTTTHEMKKEFKNAYNYFVSTKKDSAFRPLIMSYLDKKRAYSEDNFKNDYPYKKNNLNTFAQKTKNGVFEDVFVQLRKTYFAHKNTESALTYVYNIKSGKWKTYSQNLELTQGDYVLSEPDENNNVAIYNHMFSPMQELNVLKYAKLYLINDTLYVYNKDKLSISKVTFNGRTFNLYNLAFSDISSIFPGIEIINIDTISNYDVIIEKGNAKATYIIMSRYSQGWNEYNLVVEKGKVNMLNLPNMFSINSNSEVALSFSVIQEEESEFSENTPKYRFIIKTAGHFERKEAEQNVVQYDEATKKNNSKENDHTPNIMPKMFEKSESTELEDDNLLNPPEQEIEPPKEEKDMENN